jgi:hypothetical protein
MRIYQTLLMDWLFPNDTWKEPNKHVTHLTIDEATRERETLKSSFLNVCENMTPQPYI